jgi:hypothetical protein
MNRNERNGSNDQLRLWKSPGLLCDTLAILLNESTVECSNAMIAMRTYVLGNHLASFAIPFSFIFEHNKVDMRTIFNSNTRKQHLICKN